MEDQSVDNQSLLVKLRSLEREAEEAKAESSRTLALNQDLEKKSRSLSEDVNAQRLRIKELERDAAATESQRMIGSYQETERRKEVAAARIEAERFRSETERLTEELKTLKVEKDGQRKLQRRNTGLIAELKALKQTNSDLVTSEKHYDSVIAELREKKQQSMVQIKELRSKVKAAEDAQSRNTHSIETLRLEMSHLRDQLCSQQNAPTLKHTLEIVPPGLGQPDILQLKQSQGEEPPTPTSFTSHANTISRASSERPSSDNPDKQLEAKLLAAQLSNYERDQHIVRLERELKEVKAGKQIRVSRIAHTQLTTGAPISVTALKTAVASAPRRSRKQTFGQLTRHRPSASTTKLHVEPVRWAARDQSRVASRPNLARSGKTTPKDYTNPAQPGSTAASAELPDSDSTVSLFEEQSSYEDENEGNGRSNHLSHRSRSIAKKAERPDIFEVPDSGNESSSGRSDDATVPNSTEPHEDNNDDDSDTNATPLLSSYINHPLPEAATAASQFEQDFALDPDTVPSVADARLVFRTLENLAQNIRTRKTATSNIYRVGRDVLGELR